MRILSSVLIVAGDRKKSQKCAKLQKLMEQQKVSVFIAALGLPCQLVCGIMNTVIKAAQAALAMHDKR